MHSRLYPLAVALVLSLGAACRHRTAEGDNAAAQATSPVAVSFTNQSLDMARVYVILSGGQQVRIGTVQSGRSERLVLPKGLPLGGESVRFVARMTTLGRAASSGPVSVRPGDRLDITLPPTANTLNVLPSAP